MGTESSSQSSSAPDHKPSFSHNDNGPDAGDSSSATTAETPALVPCASESRSSPPTLTETEDDSVVVKSEEESQDESEDESDQDSVTDDDVLYDGDNDNAEYFRAGMTEIRRWLHGKVYKPKQHEPRSILILSTKHYQECQNACDAIVSNVEDQLRSIDGSGHVSQFLKGAICPGNGEAERIGLQGPTGSGKSSLLNALLNIPNLALADSGPVACTKFPVEYTGRTPEQTKSIFVRIQLFDEQTCWQIISEQLRAYREEMDQEDDEESESEQDEDRCQEALDLFSALFADKDPFMDDAQPQEFLCKQPFDVVFAQMKQWMTELFESKNVKRGQVTLDADTPEELNTLMEPYVGSLDSIKALDDPTCLWPLIQTVKVHVASLILNSGITLIDVPGLSDTNRYRVKVSQSSLRSCSHVVVVVRGSRMQSEKSVKEHIEKTAKQAGVGMAIVVTHNDKLSESRANATLFRDDDVLAEIEEINATIIQQIQQFKKLPKIQKEQRQAELQKLELRKKILANLKIGRKMELISRVNDDNLRKIYGETISGKSVDIASVSNTLYFKLVDANDREYEVLPTATSTGIPELRTSIRQLGERPRIRRMGHHIHRVLPHALTNVLLWCDPSQFDLSATAKPALEDSTEKRNDILDQLKQNHWKLCLEHITQPIENDIQYWMAESRMAAEQHVGQRYQGRNVPVVTANAFITKHGLHGRARQPLVDLNELLIEYVSRQLNTSFRELKDGIHQYHQKAALDLIDNCNDLIQKIENSKGRLIFAQSQDVLHRKRESMKAMIQEIFEKANRAFDRCLRSMRTFITDTEHDSCIIRILDPIYEHLIQKYPKAKGYCRKRQLAFHKYINADDWYNKFIDDVRGFVHAEMDRFFTNEVQGIVVHVFGELHRALEDFCVPPRILKEELEKRATVAESIKKHMKTLEEDIAKKFHACCPQTIRPGGPDASQAGQKRKREDST